MNKKSQLYGFTIVELLIVIVVIAILAAISIIAFNGIQGRTRDSQRMNDLRAMQKIVLAYHAVYGQYPLPAGGSGVWSGTCSSYGSHQNYIANVIPEFTASLPTDPKPLSTGGCYLYRSDGVNYMLLAHGTAENVCGGDPSNSCNSDIVRSFDRPNFTQLSFAIYSPGASTW